MDRLTRLDVTTGMTREFKSFDISQSAFNIPQTIHTTIATAFDLAGMKLLSRGEFGQGHAVLLVLVGAFNRLATEMGNKIIASRP